MASWPEAFSTGGNYINFLTADEGRQRIEAALVKGPSRLAQVKATWDVGNVPHEPEHHTGLRSAMPASREGG